MTNHLSEVEKIIQESLEVSMERTPVSFTDKLFYREPSSSKLKSSAIQYLTNRIIRSEEDRLKAELERGNILRDALNVIGMFDPKKQMEFYEKHHV